MQAKIIRTASCSKKSGKTGKNAPSVTGGQRAVTLCAGVIKQSKTENSCIFVISNNQSLISKILKAVGPLGVKFKFFSPLGFKIQSNFGMETGQMKLHTHTQL